MVSFISKTECFKSGTVHGRCSTLAAVVGRASPTTMRAVARAVLFKFDELSCPSGSFEFRGSLKTLSHLALSRAVARRYRNRTRTGTDFGPETNSE